MWKKCLFWKRNRKYYGYIHLRVYIVVLFCIKYVSSEFSFVIVMQEKFFFTVHSQIQAYRHTVSSSWRCIFYSVVCLLAEPAYCTQVMAPETLRSLLPI